MLASLSHLTNCRCPARGERERERGERERGCLLVSALWAASEVGVDDGTWWVEWSKHVEYKWGGR